MARYGSFGTTCLARFLDRYKKCLSVTFNPWSSEIENWLDKRYTMNGNARMTNFNLDTNVTRTGNYDAAVGVRVGQVTFTQLILIVEC